MIVNSLALPTCDLNSLNRQPKKKEIHVHNIHLSLPKSTQERGQGLLKRSTHQISTILRNCLQIASPNAEVRVAWHLQAPRLPYSSWWLWRQQGLECLKRSVRQEIVNGYGCWSKPCTPGEHKKRWYMGVHPPQNGGIGFDPWPRYDKSSRKHAVVSLAILSSILASPSTIPGMLMGKSQAPMIVVHRCVLELASTMSHGVVAVYVCSIQCTILYTGPHDGASLIS